MTTGETYKQRHIDIREKLKTVVLPEDGSSTQICWTIGGALKVSGTTVKNYVGGEVKDGFLAEAIFSEFKRLKMVRK